MSGKSRTMKQSPTRERMFREADLDGGTTQCTLEALKCVVVQTYTTIEAPGDPVQVGTSIPRAFLEQE